MVYDLKPLESGIDFRADKQKITSFILFYPTQETPKYLVKTPVISIDLTDVYSYDETLYNNIIENASTYREFFYECFDGIFYDDREILFDENNVAMYHRLMRIKERQPDAKITEIFPGSLLRDYELYFSLDDRIVKDMREGLFVVPRNLGGGCLGKYVVTRGIVTRVTPIKPVIQLASYICEVCGSETFQTVNKDTFGMLHQCNSQKCKSLRIKPTLVLKNRASRFTTFQKVTLSENIDDIPRGCVPKNIVVYLYGSSCGLVRPGDRIYVSGIFMPKKDAELFYDVYLIAHGIFDEKGKIGHKIDEIVDEGDLSDVFSKPWVNEMLQKGETLPIPLVDRLVSSFAPGVYGLDDIKKILLLSVIGAPLKEKNFMKIRGMINVLLVGDPGTAKSQLLKNVQLISQRGVFTTGIGSSGVGLTAAVTRDPSTRELVLEGGAFVLSDNGVCCIDELDKMSENDRVSIHEVMEQQSISINKAGINTVLNARCSIVGAANPIKGSFRMDRSLDWNLGLPVALLSRFDCVCYMRDIFDESKDGNLAKHVTNLFLNDNDQNKDEELISYDKLRVFIEAAKEITPHLPTDLGNELVQTYIERRKDNKNTTPRYLLSLVRFSLAHARIRLSGTVERIDIEEANRLMSKNFAENEVSVKPLIETKEKLIYLSIIRNVDENNKLNYEKLREICKDYKKVDIDSVINSYVDIGVLLFDGKTIQFLD